MRSNRSRSHLDFVAPRLTVESMDRYVVRAAILRELTAVRSRFRGRLLDVGCGQMPYRDYLLSSPSQVEEYIGIDIPTDRYDTKPDLTWDGEIMPLDSESFDCIVATEVLEHCPVPGRVAGEMYRVLKKDGCVFFTVPFVWPLHEVPYDEFRYTPFSLNRIFTEAGFSKVTIRALGGWDASLAQLLGLWSRRRPMSPWWRRIAVWLLLPIVRWLLRHDNLPTSFGESTMLSGLCGVALK